MRMPVTGWCRRQPLNSQIYISIELNKKYVNSLIQIYFVDVDIYNNRRHGELCVENPVQIKTDRGGLQMAKGFYGTEFEMQEIKAPVFPGREFSIADFGADKTGKFSSTEAFKKAIEECSKNGGGTVLVPDGEWFTGPIHLKSNINLKIEKNAVIVFSDKFDDYLPAVFTRWEGTECYNYSPLIYANGCENVAVTGEGTLMGNGETWWHWKKLQQDAAKVLYDAEFNNVPVKDRVFGTVKDALRPQFIQPINCKNVLIEGITIKNGPMWTIHPVYCENLIVRNIKILSHGPNTDGLNPDSCKNVLIEDCYFETGDDCIAINSGMNEDGWRVGKPCENIVVRNCRMNEGHGGVVIGSGMSGGVRNVYAHDCKFTGGDRGIRLKSMRGRGGAVENIWFEDIEITNMRDELIQINMYYGSSTILPKTDTPPDFNNINISRIRGSKAKIAVEIRGLPEHLLKEITLTDVELSADRSVLCHDAETVNFNSVKIKADGGQPAIFENVKNLKMTECSIE